MEIGGGDANFKMGKNLTNFDVLGKIYFVGNGFFLDFVNDAFIQTALQKRKFSETTDHE